MCAVLAGPPPYAAWTRLPSSKLRLTTDASSSPSPLPRHPRSLSSSHPQKRVALSASKSGFQGQAVKLAAVAPKAVAGRSGLTVVAEEERLRLHNLSPLKGSRQKKTRKGRGYGAGQVSVRDSRRAIGKATRGNPSRERPPSYPRIRKAKAPRGTLRYLLFIAVPTLTAPSRPDV